MTNAISRRRIMPCWGAYRQEGQAVCNIDTSHIPHGQCLYIYTTGASTATATETYDLHTHMADFSSPNGDIITVLVQQTHRDLRTRRPIEFDHVPSMLCRTMLFDAHLGVKPEGVRELSRAGEKLAVSLQGKS